MTIRDRTKQAGTPAVVEALEPRLMMSAGQASMVADAMGAIGDNLPRLARDIYLGSDDSSPGWLTNVNGVLFFSAADAAGGQELWMSDGTNTGTVTVKDIVPGLNDSWPRRLTKVGDSLYFLAAGTRAEALWKSDGTEAGTRMLKEIRSLSWADLNGTLLFTGWDGEFGYELWRSDGTEEGTGLQRDINQGAESSTPGYLTDVGGTLFFGADDGIYGRELWKSSERIGEAKMLADINRGAGSSTPGYLTDVGGTLFFAADDGISGRELWKSDPATGRTVMVADIMPGSDSSEPADLTHVGGTVFFIAEDAVHGRELWRSDGTAAGTVMVADINPGSRSSEPGQLTDVGGTLFFTADDGTNGRWLWKIDGTPARAVRVSPGSDSSALAELTDVNGTLFFTAEDAVHGRELWRSDGTPAGTVMVADIMPGSGGAAPECLTNVDGALFFTASDGTTGRELWVLDDNTRPVAADDTYSVEWGRPLSVAQADGVLANDTDADGHALTAVMTRGPDHGTLTLHADGSFTYAPDAGFYGTDRFTYKANDDREDSNDAAVEIVAGGGVRLQIDFHTDAGGQPGDRIGNDTVVVGQSFFVVVSGADMRSRPAGLNALAVDFAWDAGLLDEIDNPFDPLDAGSALVCSAFPIFRCGVLDRSAGFIDELKGASLPAAGLGQAIGAGGFQTFSVMRFQAGDLAVTDTPLALTLGAGGISLADAVEDFTLVIEDQTLTILAPPTIGVTDSSGAGDDASVQFTTPLSQLRPGAEDSPLVRPAYPDVRQYIDVTNTGHAPLTVFEIRINAPDVTVDLPLTDDPADDVVLAVGETRRLALTYAPVLPSLADATAQDFDLGDGLVILSDAGNAPVFEVALRGASTFNSDISYDGKVDLGELGVVNAGFGKTAGHPDFDPSSDINGDGVINFTDLGSLNVQFGAELPPAAPGQTAQPSGGSTIAAGATTADRSELSSIPADTATALPNGHDDGRIVSVPAAGAPLADAQRSSATAPQPPSPIDTTAASAGSTDDAGQPVTDVEKNAYAAAQTGSPVTEGGGLTDLSDGFLIDTGLSPGDFDAADSVDVDLAAGDLGLLAR